MTHSKRQALSFFRLLALAAALSIGLLAGCKTPPDSDDESDIPWNAPQPWEGSPMIPGLNDR